MPTMVRSARRRVVAMAGEESVTATETNTETEAAILATETAKTKKTKEKKEGETEKETTTTTTTTTTATLKAKNAPIDLPPPPPSSSSHDSSIAVVGKRGDGDGDGDGDGRCVEVSIVVDDDDDDDDDDASNREVDESGRDGASANVNAVSSAPALSCLASVGKLENLNKEEEEEEVEKKKGGKDGTREKSANGTGGKAVESEADMPPNTRGVGVARPDIDGETREGVAGDAAAFAANASSSVSVIGIDGNGKCGLPPQSSSSSSSSSSDGNTAPRRTDAGGSGSTTSATNPANDSIVVDPSFIDVVADYDKDKDRGRTAPDRGGKHSSDRNDAATAAAASVEAGGSSQPSPVIARAKRKRSEEQKKGNDGKDENGGNDDDDDDDDKDDDVKKKKELDGNESKKLKEEDEKTREKGRSDGKASDKRNDKDDDDDDDDDDEHRKRKTAVAKAESFTKTKSANSATPPPKPSPPLAWKELLLDAEELESLLFSVQRRTAREKLQALAENLKVLSEKVRRAELIRAHKEAEKSEKEKQEKEKEKKGRAGEGKWEKERKEAKETMVEREKDEEKDKGKKRSEGGEGGTDGGRENQSGTAGKQLVAKSAAAAASSSSKEVGAMHKSAGTNKPLSSSSSSSPEAVLPSTSQKSETKKREADDDDDVGQSKVGAGMPNKKPFSSCAPSSSSSPSTMPAPTAAKKKATAAAAAVDKSWYLITPYLKERDAWVKHNRATSDLFCPDFERDNACSLKSNCDFLHIYRPKHEPGADPIENLTPHSREDLEKAYRDHMSVPLQATDFIEKVKPDKFGRPRYSSCLVCPVNKIYYYAAGGRDGVRSEQGVWWYTEMKKGRDAVATIAMHHLKSTGAVPKSFVGVTASKTERAAVVAPPRSHDPNRSNFHPSGGGGGGGARWDHRAPQPPPNDWRFRNHPTMAPPPPPSNRRPPPLKAMHTPTPPSRPLPPASLNAPQPAQSSSRSVSSVPSTRDVPVSYRGPPSRGPPAMSLSGGNPAFHRGPPPQPLSSSRPLVNPTPFQGSASSSAGPPPPPPPPPPRPSMPFRETADSNSNSRSIALSQTGPPRSNSNGSFRSMNNNNNNSPEMVRPRAAPPPPAHVAPAVGPHVPPAPDPSLPNVEPWNWMERRYPKRCPYFHNRPPQPVCNRGSNCSFAHVFHPNHIPTDTVPHPDALRYAYEKNFGMRLDDNGRGNNDASFSSSFCTIGVVDGGGGGDVWYAAAFLCPAERTIYYAAGGPNGRLNGQNVFLYPTARDAISAVSGVVLNAFSSRGLFCSWEAPPTTPTPMPLRPTSASALTYPPMSMGSSNFGSY